MGPLALRVGSAVASAGGSTLQGSVGLSLSLALAGSLFHGALAEHETPALGLLSSLSESLVDNFSHLVTLMIFNKVKKTRARVTPVDNTKKINLFNDLQRGGVSDITK